MFENMFKKVLKKEKRFKNGICPIKKFDNDAICPINVIS